MFAFLIQNNFSYDEKRADGFGSVQIPPTTSPYGALLFEVREPMVCASIYMLFLSYHCLQVVSQLTSINLSLSRFVM